MYLFDLHCDTITRLYTGQRLAPGDNRLARNDAHISLDRMAGIDWCQCFAIFMPDEYRGQAAADYFEDNYRYFTEQLAENAARIVQARTPARLDAAFASGRAAALLTVEGGSALAGDLARVGRLAQCGVKILTLTWNAANELAAGCEAEGGLTPLGVRAVSALENAGVVIDVSHLNEQGFWELAEVAKRPFIATHSNSRAVCAHRRNLTDEQFRLLVSRRGLVGLNFCVSFIAEGGGDPAFSQLAAHIAHFLALGGEDTLALGSDYDGADIPSWLAPAEKIRDLHPLLCEKFGGRIADKIFYENAYRFWERYEGGEG